MASFKDGRFALADIVDLIYIEKNSVIAQELSDENSELTKLAKAKEDAIRAYNVRAQRVCGNDTAFISLTERVMCGLVNGHADKGFQQWFYNNNRRAASCNTMLDTVNRAESWLVAEYKYYKSGLKAARASKEEKARERANKLAAIKALTNGDDSLLDEILNKAKELKENKG